MLELMEFNEYDQLYILGDVCDRGPKSMELLLYIMEHPNMNLIMGNHDEWLLRYCDTLIKIKKNEDIGNMPHDMLIWLHANGGYTTADQFMELPIRTCYDIKTYLEKCPYYQELTVKGNKYVLVHAGLGENPDPKKYVFDTPKMDLIWTVPPLDGNPYPDKTLIVGHNPTFHRGPEYSGKIIMNGGTIHIDCGCVYHKALGALRLDDMETYYVTFNVVSSADQS